MNKHQEVAARYATMPHVLAAKAAGNRIVVDYPRERGGRIYMSLPSAKRHLEAYDASLAEVFASAEPVAKTATVKVGYTIEIDAASWGLNYGETSPTVIRAETRDDIRAEIEAMFERRGLKATVR